MATAIQSATNALNNAAQQQQALVTAVNGKMAQIDARVAAKETEVDRFIASGKAEWAAPDNLVSNATMREVKDGIPVGFYASNMTLEAVHPFTKGFEGPYMATQHPNAVDSVDAATQQNPYWFGRYKKGDRWPYWCGGLADGWYGLGNGHILKITATPSTRHSVHLPRTQVVYTNKLRVRFWIKLVQGSAMYVGNHAGYSANNKPYELKKSTLDAATDGWYLHDRTIAIASSMSTWGISCCIGFPVDENIEAYIALPYINAYYPTSSNYVFIGD